MYLHLFHVFLHVKKLHYGLHFSNRFPAMFDLSPTFSDDIKNMESPRFLKSHLHKLLLPKQIWTVKPKV